MAALGFFLSYFFIKNGYEKYNLFFGGVCVLMIAVVWIVPYLHTKSLAKSLADGKIIDAEIYESHIDIGSGAGGWSIELDGSAEIEEFDNIFMIFADKEKCFAIPQRVIEPEVYNEVKAILLSGTKPKDK